MARYGGLEAGGTKFVCAVGSSPDDLSEEVRFSTTTPAETMAQAVAYFAEQHRRSPLDAIGVGSFGPWSPTRTHRITATLPPPPRPTGT